MSDRSWNRGLDDAANGGFMRQNQDEDYYAGFSYGLPDIREPERQPEQFPEENIMDYMPRRCYVDKLTPTELLIRNAILEVEKLGAAPLLTETVVLLGQALNKLADFIDTDPHPKEAHGE